MYHLGTHLEKSFIIIMVYAPFGFNDYKMKQFNFTNQKNPYK
jgi:hypothetical protein